MSGTAAQQLEKLIADIETDLGIDANTPVGAEAEQKLPAPPATGSKKKEKKEKKEKAPKPAAKPKASAPAPAADQPEITKLDIRVGQIVKVWKHDTADKYVLGSSQYTVLGLLLGNARLTHSLVIDAFLVWVSCAYRLYCEEIDVVRDDSYEAITA